MEALLLSASRLLSPGSTEVNLSPSVQALHRDRRAFYQSLQTNSLSTVW